MRYLRIKGFPETLPESMTGQALQSHSSHLTVVTNNTSQHTSKSFSFISCRNSFYNFNFPSTLWNSQRFWSSCFYLPLDACLLGGLVHSAWTTHTEIYHYLFNSDVWFHAAWCCIRLGIFAQQFSKVISTVKGNLQTVVQVFSILSVSSSVISQKTLRPLP